jgi:hypothetical protein
MPQKFRGVSCFVFFSTHLNDKVEEDYEGEARGMHGDDEKYTRFGPKPEGKRSLESSKRIRNDNIKIDFKTPEFGYLDSIRLSRGYFSGYFMCKEKSNAILVTGNGSP